MSTSAIKVPGRFAFIAPLTALLCSLVLGCVLDKTLVVTNPTAVVGTWTITTQVGSAAGGTRTLHRIVRVWIDSAGRLQVSIDEVEEQVEGVRGDNAQFKDGLFSYEVPGSGRYTGTLSLDQNTIDGTWVDLSGGKTPSILVRHTYGPLPTAMPSPTPAPAIPPVTLSRLKTVLDGELAPVIEHGLLNKQSGGGLVVAVLDHGQRRILTYGTAKPDSIYEIGSITKTFTGLVLAQMVVQRKVTLDEPVRELLPRDFLARPSSTEITLLDLATHHSGLPRMPDNFAPKDPYNPYADYGAVRMHEFLFTHGLSKPANAFFLYSNVGFELLGYGLALREGLPYEGLVSTEITDPLHMSDTVVSLSTEQRARLVQGYDANFHPVQPWDWNSDFGGSGALKSTAADLLIYLDANLHPEKYASGATAGSPAATLPAAFAIDHELRADVSTTGKVALAWFVDKDHNFAHNGGTTGYNCYVEFNPQNDRAIVALYNRGTQDLVGPIFFADRVAENVRELLSGKPSIKLDVLSDDDRAALNRLTHSH